MPNENSLAATFQMKRGSLFADVSFTVDPGKPLAVLGSNGSGKSSLLHALSGLIAIRAGRIALANITLDAPGEGCFVPPAERRTSIVFQDYRLFGWLSVRGNLDFAVRAQARTGTVGVSEIDELMTRFELDQIAGHRASTLSGGQSQRLAIARALAARPELLLLDEPFSALDRGAGHSVRAELGRAINDFPGPVVLVTHDLSDAQRFCDQAILLERGRIQAAGPVDEVVKGIESATMPGRGATPEG